MKNTKIQLFITGLCLAVVQPLCAQWTQNGSDIYYNNGKVGIGTTDPGAFKLAVNGKLDADNILIQRGTISSTYIDDNRDIGLYRVGYPGHSEALLDISGFTGSTPRFQLKANYNDRLYFRAARDSESNWDSKGFREVIVANEDGNVGIGTTDPGAFKLAVNGKLDADNILIQRGTISSTYIDDNRDIGLYRVGYPGHSEALLDISGFTGSTPRFQLKANYNDRLYFRAARDSESNWDSKGFKEVIVANEDGNVGIGTTSPDAKLAVKGDIHTQEVKVDLNDAVAPDYVFESDYKLRTLAETETYIKKNKHLPEIPSAAEMEQNGVELKAMNLKLLQKVEELTLYTIQQQKEIEALKKENTTFRKLSDELYALKTRIEELENK